MSDALPILLTSVGNDGFPAVADALRQGGTGDGRQVRLVGCDARSAVAGLYLCDRGAVVPRRDCPERLTSRMVALIEEERPGVLLPLSTDDQEFYAARRLIFEAMSARVATSALPALRIANDKLAFARFCLEHGLPHPEWVPLPRAEELRDAARAVGMELGRLVLKRGRSTGAQGVKVIHAVLPAEVRLFSRDNIHVGFDEAERWLASLQPFPDDLFVSAYLPGDEYSVDILCDAGRTLAAVVRLRHATLYGMALDAEVVADPDVRDLGADVVAALGLSYVVNVQVRRDAHGVPSVIEVNPRIPGTIGLTVAAGVNMPYLGVKLALGEPFTPPQAGVGRRLLRYWQAVTLAPGELLPGE